MSMKKYIHIGYPKNFSTTLQRDFFSAHEEIYHLGIGIGSNIGYIDKTAASLFEVFLKSSRNFHYNQYKSELKDYISGHLALAEREGKKCFTASSEHLSYAFLPESLDFEVKLGRLIDLIGEDLHIILIIRNQRDLLRSIYKEFVRTGLPYSFSDFIYNFFKFQDRNFYYDLRYDLIYETLLQYLSKEQVHIFQFEQFRDHLKISNIGALNATFSELMGISPLTDHVEHHNKALSDYEVHLKVNLNTKKQHDLGNGLFETAEMHRQKDYFTTYLGLEEDFFRDVKTKRELILNAGALAQSQTNDDYRLSFSCDEKIENEIFKFYLMGNERFQNISGLKLRKEYFSSNFKSK
jgi:hypothetical protein